MIIQYDKNNIPETPYLFLCNPDGKRISSIVDYSDLSLSLKYNDLSELEITVNKILSDGSTQHCYDLLSVWRQIYVDGYGYFIINSIKENDTDSDCITKEITAVSCQSEFTKKKIYLPSGTYKFYDDINPENTFLGKIMSKMGSWTIGRVADRTKGLYRTFENMDSTCYELLASEGEDKYEYIAEFDFKNRVLSIVDTSNLVSHSDIRLSYDNVINDITIDSDVDDFVTALSVYGQNDLSITGVNPIGGNVIYNFSAFMTTDWMAQDLIDAINNWKSLIDQKQGIFASSMLSLKNQIEKINGIKASVIDKESEIKSLENQKAVLIATNNDFSEIQAQINQATSELYTLNVNLDTENSVKIQYETDLHDIQSELSFESNFTADQLSILDKYIIEQSYTDDCITVTDSMSYEEIQNQQEQLYDRSVKVLDKLSSPNIEYNTSISNVIFVKELERTRSQLSLSNVITIEKTDGLSYNLMLLEMKIDFDNHDLSLSFGNNYRLTDPMSRYANLYDRVTSTSNTISLNKGIWDYGVKSGKINAMVDFMAGSLNATHNSIINGPDQNCWMDNSGLHCVGKEDDGTDSDEQLLVTNGGILMSTDGFRSPAGTKTAIGYLTLTDKDGNILKKYGINAEILMGNIIVGSELTIQNESGSFILNSDGLISEQISDMGDRISVVEQSNSRVTVAFQKIQESIDDVSGAVDQLDSNVKNLSEDISSLPESGTVPNVENTMMSLSDEGLRVGKSNSDFNSQLDNTGLKLYSREEMIAKFTHDGAEIDRLKVEKQATLGYLQFNKYISPSGEKREHIYFVGGDD